MTAKLRRRCARKPLHHGARVMRRTLETPPTAQLADFIAKSSKTNPASLYYVSQFSSDVYPLVPTLTSNADGTIAAKVRGTAQVLGGTDIAEALLDLDSALSKVRRTVSFRTSNVVESHDIKEDGSVMQRLWVVLHAACAVQEEQSLIRPYDYTP
jgi:hypothetical protein